VLRRLEIKRRNNGRERKDNKKKQPKSKMKNRTKIAAQVANKENPLPLLNQTHLNPVKILIHNYYKLLKFIRNIMIMPVLVVGSRNIGRYLPTYFLGTYRGI